MQMISPWLFAYEEWIAELEPVVEQSVTLVERKRLRKKENDALQSELQECTKQLRNAQLMQPSGAVTGEAGGGGPHEELQEHYRLSVEQNEALAQQNQLLKIQLERMQYQLATGQQQSEDCQRATAMHAERAEAFSKQRGTAEQLELLVCVVLVALVVATKRVGCRHKAATTIQKIWRGRRVRTTANEKLELVYSGITEVPVGCEDFSPGLHLAFG
jgi:hypothetical protein